MTLRSKINVSVCGVLALGLLASAQPAEARWTFHDPSVGETITAPSGGTRTQTCSSRLKAVSGWGESIDVDFGEDPATFQVPAGALSEVNYEVWKAPPGFPNFSLAQEDFEAGEVYFEKDGIRQQATLAARVTTPPRAILPTPVPANGNPKVTDNFIFASAPISVRLSGVKPGDVLGLRPAGFGGGIFVSVTAIDCNLKVYKAKVDVIPGSKSNKMYPMKLDKLVPVRIYGSKHLRVKKIKEVHLGDAIKPAPVPADLKSKLRPKDVNRDGRPDRLYYFRQDDTDIMCIDTSVKVTGRTSDKKRFQAKVSIRTAGCDG